MGNDFEGNKKMLWKEVKQVRKGELVKDVNGQILRDSDEVKGRAFCARTECGRCQGGKYQCS